MDACVIQCPFGKGPFAPLVAGRNHHRVARIEIGIDKRQRPSELCVNGRYLLQILAPIDARLSRVERADGQVDRARIVPAVRRPRRVRIVGADEQRQRLATIARAQPRLDFVQIELCTADVGEALGEHAVLLDRLVHHLAELRHVIATRLQFGEKIGCSLDHGEIVVRLRTAPLGHHGRQQRRASCSCWG